MMIWFNLHFGLHFVSNAVQLGSTAIGIQTSDGVVLAVEKRITSPLMEGSSVEKIVEVDSHIGVYQLLLLFCCYCYHNHYIINSYSQKSGRAVVKFHHNFIINRLSKKFLNYGFFWSQSTFFYNDLEKQVELKNYKLF